MIWRSSFNSKIAKFADFITVFIGLVISYFIWDYLYIVKSSTFPKPFGISPELLLLSLVISYYYVFLLENYNAYSYQRFTSVLTECLNILKSSGIALLTAIFLSFLLTNYRIPRTALLLPFGIIIILMVFEKSFLFLLANYIRRKGRNRKRVIIIGTGTRSKSFIEAVNKNFSWGLDIIGIVTSDNKNVGIEFQGYKVIGYFEDIAQIISDNAPDELIITLSTRKFDVIRYILEFCETEGMQVRLISDFFSKITKNLQYDELYGLRILSFNMTHRNDTQLLLKRIMDIFGSIIAILLFSPFMIIAAIGILISDGLPIIYNWNVVGKNKKQFHSWKFRTMVKNADEIKKNLIKLNEMQGPVFKIKDDPRIIPFGKFLRKWSIDETPQLFSVLKGDMSLVGPRPAGPHELNEYESWQRRKLSVKPGITCLWQVNGRNKINNFDDWVKLDLEYIDNWSIWLDIKILLKTIPVVLFGKGAS